MAVLTPAYGRDYKTEKEVEEAFYSGKDFIFHDLGSPFNGTYCSCRDFEAGEVIELRFNKLLDCAVVTVV